MAVILLFKMKKLFACILVLSLFHSFLHSQVIPGFDSPSVKTYKTEMRYNVGNGKTLVYYTPKKFSFITSLPKDAAGIVSTTFSRKSLKPILALAAATGGLLVADQLIADGVEDFSRKINLSPDEKNKNVIVHLGGKDVALLRFPGNVNTAFYQVGQGFPSLLIGAGLYTYGKIKDDYRALSTASQLTEAFILMGVGTQIVKRITGRQDPSESTTPGGHWHFFPSFSQYQNYTPNYDAFPSGHLATLMSSITIFSENYPEKKWIKPVGYSLTGLVAYSMINNKVHWASDYPLALGMGYLCAKQVVKRNRQVVNTNASRKKHGEFNYTFSYLNGTLMPGVIYKF
ncbi:MAG: phosphatase PAP2 family protein [Segetibacter sp.]